MSISDKKDSWENSDIAAALEDFYNQIPDSVEVNTTSDAPGAAYNLASQLNNLRDELELVRHVEPGMFGGEYNLVGGWPNNEDVPEIAWEQSGQVIKDIAEKAKAAEQSLNTLTTDSPLSDPLDHFANARKPEEGLSSAIASLVDAAEEYLQQFPQLGFSVKKDVAPLPDVDAELGPTTIACDPNLEASLQFETNQAHYIGMLEGEDGIFSSPYLPVRLQPQLSNQVVNTQEYGAANPSGGWGSPNYSVLNKIGAKVDNWNSSPEDLKVGIEVPLGFEITITEIVQSKTGTWVGFISSDPKKSALDSTVFGEGGIFSEEDTNVLYTKAEYVRIKKDALNQLGPDPYVSEGIDQNTNLANSVASIKGAKLIEPANNNNWDQNHSSGSIDVRLEYYNFFLHNKKIIGSREIDGVSDGEEEIVYNNVNINNYQTLRYSEGFFYFIVGSAPRKTEAEIINESDQDLDLFPEELEKQKIAQKVVSHEEMRDNAWNNLLEYLGKSQAGVSQKLIDNLKQNYFVQVARKTNTQTPDPSNEKILFAIRAEYIESLPKNPRLYKNNFKEGSPFLQGNNYATSFPVSQLPSRCKIIATHLKSLKAKIDESNSTVENANQIEYDLEEQIKVVEEMAETFNEFLHRQAFPLSSNNSALYELIREGVNTSNSEHLIQIGVKDNGQIGGDVRETISYVLFSPDPLQLGMTDALEEFTLDYFDPYALDDEAASRLPRSAISLDVALPWLREKFEGEYGSRALHLLLSYESGNKFLGAKDTKDKWMDYLVKYMVPPVRIYLSKRLSTDEIELECEEIIRKLNNAGPVLTFEERLLQEKLYNNEDCMAAYYEKFSQATPAASPGMTKRELEKKAKRTESGGNVLDNQYVKILYTGFFNTLDSSSISALIMACLQKKLGIALTAEAICETAILKLVESTGADSVEKVMLANALLAPDSEASQLFLQAYNGAPPFAPDPQRETTLVADEDGVYTLDKSYNNAPIATSMFLSQRKLSPNLRQVISQVEGISPNVDQLLTEAEERGERVNLNDKKWWVMEGDTPRVNTAAVEAIKELERTGQQVNLIPAIKNIDEENTNLGQPTIVYYGQSEIDNERARLKTLGYTKAESDAVMVASGYLMPDPEQYNVVLGDGKASSTPPGGLTGPTGQLPYNYSAVEDARAIEQSAEDWLNYMKGTVGLASICELIVGDILDGFQNLIKDPGAFFSGGGAGWWNSFVEGLKRQLSPKVPTLRFPDFLSTDNHMGDYGEKLLKTILAMVAQMLGQIVNLLLKNALEQCLEEDSDLGPSGRPPASGPDIPFPTLEAADLPTIDGLSNADIVAWMKDILDNVSTGQLCALLRGDATRQTLLACLGRTQTNWILVYQGGVNTTSTISSIFKKVGDSVNIDVCNVIDSPALVANLCDAIFDRDARCAALLGAGLTKEECEEQINQEIEDLRNRVAGVAGLSMLDINPLANTFPPICGENGTFTIPPGVRDTMNRITDNMLTNVKGSLMVDMEGLKFFSSPPRALLAATDPEELKRTHAAFLELAKKPKTKKCLALIADPQNHVKEYFGNSPSGKQAHYNIYPFCYNGKVSVGQTPQPGWLDFGPLSDKDLGVNFFQSVFDASRASEVLPLHVGLLNDANAEKFEDFSDSIGKKLKGDVKDIATAYVESKFINQNDEIQKDPLGYLNNQIALEYDKDIKIQQLEALTIFEEQLFTSPLLTTQENDYPRFPGNLDKFAVQGVDLSVYGTTASLSGFRKHKNVLSRSWPLNTKLKDIDNRPWTWYYMMIAYTGVNLPIRPDKTGTYPRRNFINDWLKKYDFWENEMDPSNPDELYDGTDFNPYNSPYKKWWLVYKASPGLRNIVKITRRILLESDKTLFKRKQLNDSSKTREFNLAVGFMELTIAEAAGLDYDRIKEAYPNMQDYFSNPNNAVIFGTYSNPTIKAKTVSKVDTEDIKPAGYYYGEEYYGNDKSKLLTDSYGKPISPAGDPLKYEEEEVVIIKADTVTTSEETLDEEFKNSDRWNDYEFYYPHFLAFEKIFRDTESSLNADPQELIDRFSGDGEKVNQNLYDRLNFIPDSIMPESLRKEGTVIDILATDLEDLSHADDVYAFNTEKHSPNILKYDLGEKLTLGFEDGLDKQALEAISSPDAFARLQTLADQVESLGSKSLIHQNVLTPLTENKEIQTFELKNVSKLIEGITKEFGETVFVDSEELRILKEETLTLDDLETDQIVALVNQTPDYIAVRKLNLFSASELAEIAEEYHGSGAYYGGIIEAESLFVFNMSKLLAIAATSLSKTPGAPLTADDKLDYEFLREALVVDGQLVKYDDEYETSILADQEAVDFINSLIQQPDVIDFIVQLSAPKVLFSDPPSPPHAIPDDSRISNETYNFNFAGQLPPDVQNLVQSLYSTNNNLADAFSSDYNNLYSDTVLEETNYKAQIFGQLLSKKLNDKLQQYLPPGSSYDQDNLNNIKKFLSVEGFSAMQYAYSTQMFAKMKASRIHNRKFMKKIWKKILKSPMVTDGVDLRCEKNFEKEGVPKDSYVFTETDFFDIEEIKPRIIKLYEDALCKDVYEESVDGQDSTRMSLLQGMISLVIKVYTLEMCLASVIAWDSFDLEDVFKDTAMTAIILQNISEDFDIEFLSFFATEMLRKESGLTDLQLAELRIGVTGAPQNGLEYLIGKEAESISAIVKDMFVNSFPLTTDLRVSLLKNSDPDFVEDFSREVSNNAVEYPAYKYASYATGALGAPLEYISDVRIKDNIYTMNFGSGKKLPYVDALELEDGGAFNQEYGEHRRVDLFGLSAQTGFARKNNKNYFHSLPMNWYHAVDSDAYRSDYYLWKPSTWKVDPLTKRYDQFKEKHAAQDALFGSTDCFSFENNVETSHGNDLNLKFGNVVFEPYVRVIDWAEDEERNFVAELYVDENGEPCKESTLVGTFDIKDFIEEINEKIDDFRTAKNNVFNCEMRDYVPLSAWSYFFNRYFMSAVTDEENFALRALFNNYGLAPFFKKISFGMRMSYINPMLSQAADINFLREQFNSTDSSTPLKRAKSIVIRRPYASILPDGEARPPGIIDELHIPIVEVEKEIISAGGTNSFRIEEGPLVNFDQMGAGLDQGSFYYVRNPHQFFYNNLANGLLQEIKNSPEFKLMYDYLFPMRRYMALATIMASAGLSKFIAKPTDVLDRTKQSLANIIDNISNSTDYKHVPDPIANLLAERALRAEAGTGGKEPDLTKEILKIVLRTPLLILKGFVEITDPAIITAKRIIDISNAIAVNTLAAIKQGVATAKRIIQSGIDAAKQLLQQLEMQLSMGVGFAKSAVATLPEVQTSSGMVKMSEYVTIDDGSGVIEEWVLELGDPPFDEGETPTEWTEFKKQFNDLKKLRNEYLKNKKKLEDLERKKRKLEEESKVKIRKAENTVKDIYQSPYLLPGIWTAMVPSVVPYGGGINPFPMPLPFVSTFPGMIYLAILFIDAIEEKAHDDMQNTKDPNCEDQL